MMHWILTLMFQTSYSDRNSVAESLFFQNDQENPTPKPSSTIPPAHELPTPLSDPPLALQLVVLHALPVDKDDNQFDLDECMNASDEDTKKFFYLTDELKKLNKSSASDRRTFIEQLKNVFQTSAKVDLRYDLGGHLLPPVPTIPLDFAIGNDSVPVDLGPQLLDVQQPTMPDT